MDTPFDHPIDDDSVLYIFKDLILPFCPIMDVESMLNASKYFNESALSYPISHFMVFVAKLIKFENKSPKGILWCPPKYTLNSVQDLILCHILCAIVFCYQNQYTHAKTHCEKVGNMLTDMSNRDIEMNPKLFMLLWCHTILTIPYVHDENPIPATWTRLATISIPSISILATYRRNLNDVSDHYLRLQTIMGTRDYKQQLIDTSLDQFIQLERAMPTKFKVVENALRKELKAETAYTYNSASVVMDYIGMIQSNTITPFQRRMQYHRRECNYIIQIIGCWLNEFGGLHLLPRGAINALLDQAVEFNEKFNYLWNEQLKVQQKSFFAAGNKKK